MRVIGSQAISTRPDLSVAELACFGCVVVMRASPYQGLWYPVVSSRLFLRHFGSLSTLRSVIKRSLRMRPPYAPLAAPETLLPGGASMKGMNLSGKPGIVQPMQIPPTFGQPPTPFIQPRLATLQLTTGPQHPSFTMHFFDPNSCAKSACS